MIRFVASRCSCWGCRPERWRRYARYALVLVGWWLTCLIAFGCSYDYSQLAGVGAGGVDGGADTQPPPPPPPPDAREAPPLDLAPDSMPEAPLTVPPWHCKNFPTIACTLNADCGACGGTGPTGGLHCPSIGSTASACCTTACAAADICTSVPGGACTAPNCVATTCCGAAGC